MSNGSCILQVRPGSGNISSGISDKAQLSRTESWTRDVIEYLQHLLDEFFAKNNSHSTAHSRDRSPQILYPGSVHQRGEPVSTGLDIEDSSLHFRWWYMVRLFQWHYAEGLILPSLIIDWVLRQLQVLFLSLLFKLVVLFEKVILMFCRKLSFFLVLINFFHTSVRIKNLLRLCSCYYPSYMVFWKL